MSPSPERSLVMHRWMIGYEPPVGGVVPWGGFSKSSQWYPQNDSWGVLPFPLFRDQEEADAAFAENETELRRRGCRVVKVAVTVSEIEEEGSGAGEKFRGAF
jgi:hypothetical protein